MFVTKLKIGTALVVGAAMLTAFLAGSPGSVSQAQETETFRVTATLAQAPGRAAESDEDFIRRVSKDLRGIGPSPAEIHFFTANKDAGKRQKLIDLFIQERQAKQRADGRRDLTAATLQLSRLTRTEVHLRSAVLAARASAIHTGYYKELLAASKDKKEVAAITQNYLDRLQQYVKEHPKNDDVPEAMLHISLVYRAQGKTVEADAWRDKLRKEHPNSPAAKTAEATLEGFFQQYRVRTVIDLPDVNYETLVLPKKEEKK